MLALEKRQGVCGAHVCVRGEGERNQGYVSGVLAEHLGKKGNCLNCYGEECGRNTFFFFRELFLQEDRYQELSLGPANLEMSSWQLEMLAWTSEKWSTLEIKM